MRFSAAAIPRAVTGRRGTDISGPNRRADGRQEVFKIVADATKAETSRIEAAAQVCPLNRTPRSDRRPVVRVSSGTPSRLADGRNDANVISGLNCARVHSGRGNLTSDWTTLRRVLYFDGRRIRRGWVSKWAAAVPVRRAQSGPPVQIRRTWATTHCSKRLSNTRSGRAAHPASDEPPVAPG